MIPAGTTIDVVVSYLEMLENPGCGDADFPAGHALIHAEDPPVWYFRMLYDRVGRDYSWEDMPLRSDEVVAEWMDPARMSLWTLIEHGWPHGFFMLDEGEADETELTYFGLVREAIGKGLGGWLLKTAILTAWEREGLRKLCVNTCTLDHPRALQTYQKAGFHPVRREDRTRVLRRDRDMTLIPD